MAWFVLPFGSDSVLLVSVHDIEKDVLLPRK